MKVLQCRIAPIFGQPGQQGAESGEIGLGGRTIDGEIDQPGLFGRGGLEVRIRPSARDDRAPPGSAFHQASLLQRREGPRDRGEVDAKHARDIALRRQSAAGRELPARDPLGDRGGQLSVDGLAAVGEPDLLEHDGPAERFSVAQFVSCYVRHVQ